MPFFRDGSVWFTINQSDRSIECRVSAIALDQKDNISWRRLTDAEYVAIFQKHRTVIEQLALSKVLSSDYDDNAIFVKSTDLNPGARLSVVPVSAITSLKEAIAVKLSG